MPPATAVRLDVLKRVGLANLFGAAFVFFYFSILARTTPLDRWDRDDSLSLVAFAAYMIITSSLVVVLGVRELRRALGWFERHQAPSEGEIATTLGIPAFLARSSFAYWIGAALLFGGLNLLYGNDLGYSLRLSIGILMGGLTVSALVYLLVERRLRSVFAVALTGTEIRNRAKFGIGWRLLLAWLLGSAVPLLGIALAPLGRDQATISVGPTIALAVAGLLAGGILTVGAARSVAAPLDGLRDAAHRLQRGDLSTEVPVDDAGEIGMLQASFNHMISGLREQDRLRDLFGRYVGHQVAREALERDVRLGGELREVSVLFVDVIGSTALAERRSPTEVVDILNRFFAAVVRAVGHEGGWVNKFEGDGALCIFGAPVPQADHAVQALRAARRLQLALRDLEHLDAAVGVSSGLVVAGNVGAEQRYEYTVIGDPVNEAARLCDLAKARQAKVLASEAVSDAAGPIEAAAWTRVGTVDVRGRKRRVVIYEPVGDDATALAARSTPSSSTS